MLLLIAVLAVQDSSPFRPLPLPSPTAYRTASGAPGNRYWQNTADYTIEATLDTSRHEIRATGQIRYTNHSPDTLSFIWLQLDQNILAATSLNRSAPPPTLVFAGAPFILAVTGPAGGFTLDPITSDRGRVTTYIWDTMARLDLERPLAPGDSATLSLGWRFTVPENGAARMGRDGTLYEIAQWYPRLAVYDDVNGWNTLPYIGSSEFYLEYGRFDVRITVPPTFLVAATGELRNPETVLTADQRTRLAQAMAGERPVAVIGGGEAGDALRTRPNVSGNLTWHFTVDRARDFAFATGAGLQWDAMRYDGGPNGQRLVQVLYRAGAANWGEAIRMAHHAIRDFSERWGMYPWPVATAFEGPILGMEYPGIVFVPADTSRHGLSWVLMHELGHQWFPMMVGNDERRHAWMDEGFNSFIDLYTVAGWWEGNAHADSVLDGSLTSYAANALRQRELPMSTPPYEVRNVYWNAYQKPALMLRLLREEVLGAEVFDRAFREYIRRWSWRHPQPADFFRTMENVSGRDLDWFWRGWVYTTARLDQSVDSVVPVRESRTTGPIVSYRIGLGYRQDMVMPVELLLVWNDGTEETRRIPVEMWSYGRRFALTVEAMDRRLTRVEVDPRRVLPDVERANNRWPRGR